MDKLATQGHLFDQTGGPVSGTEMETSRFRLKPRSLSREEDQLQQEIIATAIKMERLFGRVKSGRYRSLAFTALEESIGWITKEITQ